MSDNPWDIPYEETLQEFASLFEDNEEYSLCETGIKPDNYIFYELGRIIADLHSAGLVHGDLHKRNVMFQAKKLNIMLIDFGASSIHKDLEPHAMARDFLAPFLDFERPHFLAFLAGYARSAFICVEPKRPGFVNELIGLLGGVVTQWPRPRQTYVDTQNLIETFRSNMAICEGKISLEVGCGEIIADILEDQTELILNLFAGFVVAGIDYSILLSPLDNTTCNSQKGKAFLAFLKNPGVTTFAQMQLISEESRLASTLLIEINNSMLNNKITELEQPNNSALQALVKITSSCGFNPSAINRFLDSMIDVCNSISVFLDSQSNTTESIRFAQFAFIIYQCSIHDSDNIEERWVNIERVHQNLTWHKHLIEESKFIIFMHNIAYIQSQCIALNTIYEASVRDCSPKISFLWMATKTYRSILATIYNSLGDLVTTEQLQNITTVTSQLAKGLFRCLQSHMQCALLNPQIYMDENGDFTLSNEIHICLQLIEKLQSHDSINEECCKILKELREYAI